MRAGFHALPAGGSRRRRARRALRRRVNDDLNLPRALAVAVGRAARRPAACHQAATLLRFDGVLGLQLAEWQPVADDVPEEIMAPVRQRQQAREDKRWRDADALRERVNLAGYDIEDTPQGARVRMRGGMQP